MSSANPRSRRAVWSWILYDWANSAFATTVMAGFFPIFFKLYYSAGTDVTVSTAKLGVANTISSLAIALAAPILGTIADRGSYKKRFLALMTFIGITMTACLSWIHQGDWITASIIYAIANLGFGGCMAFYDAMLPLIAERKNIDYISSLGYAMGYLGGGVLFLFNVIMYQKPEWFGLADGTAAVQWSFLSVAIWWAVFSIPIFLWVQEPQAPSQGTILGHAREAFAELGATFSRIRSYRTAMIFLAAFFLYNDGVGTTIKMAVDYGLSIGFKSSDLILALLLVQFVGFPCALLFGKFSSRFHPKRAIFFAIAVYLFILFWATQMSAVWEFYFLAVLIGTVQGGIQALSRSYFARLIDEERAGEFYGFYNLLGKFTGLIGPALMGFTGLLFASPRVGILSVTILFLAGGFLLRFVDETNAERELKAARG